MGVCRRFIVCFPETSVCIAGSFPRKCSTRWNCQTRGIARNHLISCCWELTNIGCFQANDALAHWSSKCVLPPAASYAKGIYITSCIWPVSMYDIYMVSNVRYILEERKLRNCILVLSCLSCQYQPCNYSYGPVKTLYSSSLF